MEQPRDMGTSHGYQASSQDSQRNGHETCCARIPGNQVSGVRLCVCVYDCVFVDVLVVVVVLMMVMVRQLLLGGGA